jgi:tetratricopeptide (TPR) repeat protein
VNSDELNAIYKNSCDIIIPYIRLDGVKEVIDPEKAEESLKKGIDGLQKVLEINPDNWSARWMLGKAMQALGFHERAYEEFLTAHKKVSDQHIMRELALECLETNRFTQAVYYCHIAMEFDPNDYTLWSNMALAQLFKGDVDNAEKWANKSLEKIPGDLPALNILKIIADIKSGKRKIPSNFSALESEENEKSF